MIQRCIVCNRQLCRNCIHRAHEDNVHDAILTELSWAVPASTGHQRKTINPRRARGGSRTNVPISSDDDFIPNNESSSRAPSNRTVATRSARSVQAANSFLKQDISQVIRPQDSVFVERGQKRRREMHSYYEGSTEEEEDVEVAAVNRHRAIQASKHGKDPRNAEETQVRLPVGDVPLEITRDQANDSVSYAGISSARGMARNPLPAAEISTPNKPLMKHRSDEPSTASTTRIFYYSLEEAIPQLYDRLSKQRAVDKLNVAKEAARADRQTVWNTNPIIRKLCAEGNVEEAQAMFEAAKELMFLSCPFRLNLAKKSQHAGAGRQ